MAYQSKYSGTEIDEAIGKVGSKLDQTGDASNTTVDFADAENRTELTPKDKMSVLIGKISKWLKGLKNVAFSASYNDLNDTPEPYTLPIAGSSTLGGIKIGNNLTMREDGTVDAEAGGSDVDTSNFATKDKYGDTGINFGRKSGTTVGVGSSAIGSNNTVTGEKAVAVGANNTASGYSSFAGGYNTTASKIGQVALGRNNIADSSSALIVGNGVSTASNAFTVGSDGTTWAQGDVYVGSTSGTNKDTGSERLAKVSEVPVITFGTEELEPRCVTFASGANTCNV